MAAGFTQQKAAQYLLSLKQKNEPKKIAVNQ